MSKRLEGKVALVTGGSRGIGAAIANRLAADGAAVAITYTKGADAAAAVVGAIKSSGGKAIAVQGDATAADQVNAAIDKTVAALGRLDIFVNNAGTAIPKKFEETTLEEFDRVIDLNLRGAFVATQGALKHLNKGGRIILISEAGTLGLAMRYVHLAFGDGLGVYECRDADLRPRRDWARREYWWWKTSHSFVLLSLKRSANSAYPWWRLRQLRRLGDI